MSQGQVENDFLTARARNTRLGLLAMAVAFLGTALLFLPRLGIEADEAMLANGIYDHGAPWYSWKFGESEIPVTLISYLGALKTWLYNPYFLIWHPGPVSLRLPMVLLGAVSLWLFFAFLDRTLGDTTGRTAAWIGALLLATDSSYLLIEATDFGFVAIQFALKMAALLLILRFVRTDSRGALAASFFLVGLALWDKAVFLWVLFGLTVAVVAVFPGEVRKRLTVRNVSLASAALIVGALPLVIYNIARPLETIRASAKVENQPVLAKADLLVRTMDGYVLFGFLTAGEPGPVPGQPKRWIQSLSLKIAELTRHPQHNLSFVAFVLSILALPFIWKTDVRAPALFGVIACAATWLPMALTAGAGAAAQHVILLWPFHFLVIAAVLSRVPPKWAIAAAVVLCGSNVLVTNQYYADLVRNGPAIRWTDALDPLNRYLLDAKPERVFVADWGFLETLNLVDEGEAPFYSADTTDPEAVARMLGGPRYLFVSHTPNYVFHPEIRARIEEVARSSGYEEEHLATISDRNGRPTFDVFRFRKVHL